jgi:hypothetical protein
MDAPVGASCPLVAAVDADPGVGDSLLVDAEGATCIEDSSERQQPFFGHARRGDRHNNGIGIAPYVTSWRRPVFTS